MTATGPAAPASVLIVEDDPDNAALMGRWLDVAGFAVRYAISGEAALAEFHRARPDVVVLDLFLPGIDGIEVLRRLRTAPQWERLPVVVTSIAHVHRAEPELTRQVDTWLVKPFSSRALQGAVTTALRRRRELSTTHEPRPDGPAGDAGQGLS
jgi:DNA-binding response OmpR family regulator